MRVGIGIISLVLISKRMLSKISDNAYLVTGGVRNVRWFVTSSEDGTAKIWDRRAPAGDEKSFQMWVIFTGGI